MLAFYFIALYILLILFKSLFSYFITSNLNTWQRTFGTKHAIATGHKAKMFHPLLK